MRGASSAVVIEYLKGRGCGCGLPCIWVDHGPHVITGIFIAPVAIVFIALTAEIRNHSANLHIARRCQTLKIVTYYSWFAATLGISG